MTILGGFNRAPLPTVREIQQVSPDPQTVAGVNAAIKQSVQEFPPAINTGAFFAELVRGPLLPPFGTKDRDRILRLLYRGEYNNLVQAVVTAMIKKIVTIPWQLNGDRRELVSVPDDSGRLHTIAAVDHYQNVLQNAQFGAGWETFLSMWLEDFFTQDFGGVMELIGPGEPIGPIDGPVMGIAQLDSGRCYITGNPYFPIMYFSLISGSLHRMHTSRIVRLVDSPSPDERYFRIGLSALSRTVAVANRQQLMSRYIESLVDDKPPPGFMLLQGFTEKQRDQAVGAYKREQSGDDKPIWGKTLWIYSLDADKPIKAEHFPFATAPAKFDWVKYTELDVHALAAGFNIDIQEIWELTGRGGAGGNSGQSKLLHQKSEAKMIGFLMQNLERAFNRRVLTHGVTIEFKYNDPLRQENEATVDGQLMTNVVAGASVNILSTIEARQYLAAQSERFKSAMSQTKTDVIAPDASDSIKLEDTATYDMIPSPSQASSVPQLGAGGLQAPAPSGQEKVPSSGLAPRPSTGAPSLNAAHASQPRKRRPGNQMPAGITKEFSVTAHDFERSFTKSLVRGVDGRLDPSAFEEALLDMLATGAVKAYGDGLRAGGLNDPLNDDHTADIQDFLVGQIDYIDGLSKELASGALQPATKELRGEKGVTDVLRTIRRKAEMWVNKSLKQVFARGRLFADPNSNYEFTGIDGQESCETCQRLGGQVHQLKEWHARNLVPQIDGENFDCGSWLCQHVLVKTDKPEYGAF